MALENIIGKPVQAENFFGRDDEVEQLRAISEREHVLMLAPRRVGKTSLLHALKRHVDATGAAIGIYVSVATATTEAQFVQAVLNAIYATKHGRSLQPSLLTRARRLGRGVKGVKGGGLEVAFEQAAPAWQDEADRAFAVIFTSDRPLLILIDELPVLVLAVNKLDPTGARVRNFLLWFRNLRQHPDGAGTLRFVFAGSIGLDNVTRRHHLTDTINDLRLWPLGPFERAAAHDFLSQLATSYKLDLTPSLCGEICDAAEWLIPFHLQVIFGALREHKASPSSAILRDVLESLIDRQPYFSYWNERLHDSLGAPYDAFAHAALATCAHGTDGANFDKMSHACASIATSDLVERKATLKWVLDVLVNDGYLVEIDRRWRFRSGLLRRYWRKHVTR